MCSCRIWTFRNVATDNDLRTSYVTWWSRTSNQTTTIATVLASKPPFPTNFKSYFTLTSTVVEFWACFNLLSEYFTCFSIFPQVFVSLIKNVNISMLMLGLQKRRTLRRTLLQQQLERGSFLSGPNGAPATHHPSPVATPPPRAMTSATTAEATSAPLRSGVPVMGAAVCRATPSRTSGCDPDVTMTYWSTPVRSLDDASDSDDGQGFSDRHVGYKAMSRHAMTSPARAASEPCPQYFWGLQKLCMLYL